MLNSLQLSAHITQVAPLRFTPAGIPALNVTLRHSGEANDAGTHRKTTFEVRGIAFGANAEALAKASLDVEWGFKGFLGPARNGKGVVFHIQDIHRI